MKKNLKSQISNHKSQAGQVVIVLALIMLVILTVGLTITQRSVSTLSNSTRTEQTSRAFFAAEAGLEQALLNGGRSGAISTGDLGNNSSAKVTLSDELPGLNQAISLPHTNKAEFAQFWLANPNDLSEYYKQNQFDVYFGNSEDATIRNLTPGASDKPAIEVNVITRAANGSYSAKRMFFDSQTTPARGNNFQTPGANFTCASLATLSTTLPAALVNSELVDDPKFYCKVVVTYTGTPVMVRIRVLYSNGNQAVAIAPNPTSCAAPSDCSFPPQIKVYTSTGASGQTKRTVKVFETKKTLPSFMDFALFSAGSLDK